MREKTKNMIKADQKPIIGSQSGEDVRKAIQRSSVSGVFDVKVILVQVYHRFDHAPLLSQHCCLLLSAAGFILYLSAFGFAA